MFHFSSMKIFAIRMINNLYNKLFIFFPDKLQLTKIPYQFQH